jgi:deoxycytidylate deaminase
MKTNPTIHPQDLQFCVQTARLLSARSRATRAKVGCVIFHVPTRRIISLGYNGTPENTSNIMEIQGKTVPEVIHAEHNALRKLSWYERAFHLKHCILLVTHTPCASCAQHIVDTKIPIIYYLDNYGSHVAASQTFHKHARTFLRVLS